MKNFTFLLVFFCCTTAILGQLTITPNQTANQLAQSLAGAGVVISNATLNCNSGANGMFQDASAAMGMSEGIILGTGLVDQVPGIDIPFSGFPSTSLFESGDADLDQILSDLGETYTTYDACVLEFDITVLGDSLQFNYVMGSEEYAETNGDGSDNFVCGDYNDIFTFFIDGPNPSGGNYNNQNIALIPGSTTPVSINTVNSGLVGPFGGSASTCVLTNTQYYAGFVNGSTLDGHTVLLQAVAATTPCETYHLKLAIADGGDGTWDSGVFLEAGSFSSEAIEIGSSTSVGGAFTDAIEGCVDGLFTFEIENPLPQDFSIHFEIAGNAINGTDYIQIPDSVVIPAGDTTGTIIVSPILDGVFEGQEEIIIRLVSGCNNVAYDSASLYILDEANYNIQTSGDTICLGGTTLLQAQGAQNYQWVPTDHLTAPSSGTTFASPDTTTTYCVEYTLGNCVDTAQCVDVVVSELALSFTVTDATYSGANDGSITANVSGGVSPYTYTWNPNVGSTATINNLAAGTYTVTVTDNAGCMAIDSATVSESLDFSVDSIDAPCAGDSGTLILSGMIPNWPYIITYQYNGIPQPPLYDTSDASGQIVYFNQPPGAYDSVIVEDTFNHFIDTGFTFINEPPVLNVQVSQIINVFCQGDSTGSIEINVTGGTPGYTYLWSNGSTDSTLSGIPAGSYRVIVTDANGCMDSTSFTGIDDGHVVVFDIFSDSTTCFNSSDGEAWIDLTTTAFPPYTYQWNDPLMQTTDTAFNLIAGVYTVTVTDGTGCNAIDSAEVFSPPTMEYDTTVRHVTCFNGNDGMARVTVQQGGTPPYTYNWLGGLGANDSISGVSAGIYQLEITDGRGCVDTVSVEITEPTPISLFTDSVDVRCYGENNGMAIVSASNGTPGYTYLWTPSAQTTDTASNLVAGSYQIVVTDSNGCTSASVVNIDEPDSLQIQIIDVVDVLCNGDATGHISTSTSGGTPPYTYSWNNGASSQDLTNIPAGTYSVVVTDANGCSSSADTVVNEPPALSMSLASDSVSCYNGSDGLAYATLSGGAPPYTYNWSNGGSTDTINNVSAGTYSVVVTDANGCTISGSIDVDEPEDIAVTFDVSDVSCFGEDNGSISTQVTSGGNPPFTDYSWDHGANGSTINNLSAGVYTVTITDTKNCTYVRSTQVDEPTALTLTVDSQNISCFGESDGMASVLASGATPPYSYVWSPGGQTTAIATNLSPALYTVTVTDDNGCTENESIEVVEPPAIEIVDIEIDSTSCFGKEDGSILIAATGGTGVLMYSIDNISYQSDPYFSDLRSLLYPVSVSDENGCIAGPVNIAVEQPAPMIVSIVPDESTIELNTSLQLNAAIEAPYSMNDVLQFQWDPHTALNCFDCSDPIFTGYNSINEYELTVTYGNNCTSTASAVIYVENNLKLFIPNAFTPNNADGFNDIHYVFGDGIEVFNMSIYNRWGEKVFESEDQARGWDGVFKGEMQPPGVYTYHFKGIYLDGKEIEEKGSITLIK